MPESETLKLSPVFKQKLNDLIGAVQEFERDDFIDQLGDLAYVEFITPEEHVKLHEWAKSDSTPAPLELLEKCPHQYACATLLQLMIADGE